MSRAGYGDDVKVGAGVGRADDSERLLALFGVHRQRSVGEAEPVRLVNDVDHATHDFDPPNGKRRRHRHNGTDRGRTARVHNKAGSFVYSPLTKRLNCPVENVVAITVRRRPAIKSVARRWLGRSRDADGVVRERVTCSGLRERKQFGGRWSSEAERHGLSLSHDPPARPHLP